MNIILFLVLGLVVGLLARAILPGRQHMGLIATTLLGIAGSFIGGFIAAIFSSQRRILDLSTTGFFGSLIGALLLLFIYTRVVARRELRRGPY
jgi:uncharacterized membrane protein YeaQ/YmgE (transglycosylase-associated protein family)